MRKTVVVAVFVACLVIVAVSMRSEISRPELVGTAPIAAQEATVPVISRPIASRRPAGVPARGITVPAGLTPRDASWYLTDRDYWGFIHPDEPIDPDLPPPDVFKPANEVTLLDARSPQEAAWLDQNGYPLQEDLDLLDQMSEQELADRSAHGDIAAQALLGKKLYDQNDVFRGQQNLQEAAARGSLWAILEMAESTKKAKGYDVAYALYQLAALRGDWMGVSYGMVDGFAEGPAMRSAIRNGPMTAATWYATLASERARFGLGPFQNTPRPGIGWRARSQQGAIGIYARRRRGG